MHPLVVIPAAAEAVGLPEGGRLALLADASQTTGALGANRLTVGPGRDGAAPPRLPHAFGAAGTGADLLAVLATGVERFGFLRWLTRVQHGLESFDGLRAEQDRHDVHFVDDERWSSPRGDR